MTPSMNEDTLIGSFGPFLTDCALTGVVELSNMPIIKIITDDSNR
jgi:hypothetical protein